MKRKPPKLFKFQWVFEAFDDDPTFSQKHMFGCLAAYVRGRLVMVLSEDPGERRYRSKQYAYDIWHGILIPTEKVFHESLMKEFPSLIPHPVLGKWLYLPAGDEHFETLATELAKGIAKGDPRFGVEPEMRSLKPNKTAGFRQ